MCIEGKDLLEFIRREIKNNPYGYMKSLSPYKNDILSLFYIDTGDYKRNLYHLINDIKTIPKCIQCNVKDVAFKNINKGYGVTCSRRCSSILASEKHKSKWTNISESEKKIINEKREKTNQEKYGVNFPLQSETCKKTFEETCLNKYGENHHMKLLSIQDKIKTTNREKYGVDYYFQTKTSRKSSSDRIKELHANNHFETYFQDNYGVSNWYQTEEGLRHTLKLKGIENLFDELEHYLNGERLFEISNKLDISVYLIKKIIEMKGITYKPEYHMSSFQREIYDYVTSIHENVICANREILGGKEIDILIPDLSLGIECNGVYWHSNKFKDSKYHKEKYLQCKENGIKLIQITDEHYYQNSLSWKEFLHSKLVTQKMKINNVTVSYINNYMIKSFINENSILKHQTSNINLGLFSDSF